MVFEKLHLAEPRLGGDRAGQDKPNLMAGGDNLLSHKRFCDRACIWFPATLLIFICLHLSAAESQPAIRLGLIFDEAAADQEALATTQLVSIPGIELVERQEVEALLGERSQWLSGLTHGSEAKLGASLRADALLVARKSEMSPEKSTAFFTLTLVGANSGALLAQETVPIGQLPAVANEMIVRQRHRLTIPADKAVAVTIVPAEAPHRKDLAERELFQRALVVSLARQPHLFVLERESMAPIVDEAVTGAVADSPLWRSGFLLTIQAGRDPNQPANYVAKLTLHRKGQPEETWFPTGSSPEAAAQIAAQELMEKMGTSPARAEFDTKEEIAFFKKKLMRLRSSSQGLTAEYIRTGTTLFALGDRSVFARHCYGLSPLLQFGREPRWLFESDVFEVAAAESDRLPIWIASITEAANIDARRAATEKGSNAILVDQTCGDLVHLLRATLRLGRRIQWPREDLLPIRAALRNFYNSFKNNSDLFSHHAGFFDFTPEQLADYYMKRIHDLLPEPTRARLIGWSVFEPGLMQPDDLIHPEVYTKEEIATFQRKMREHLQPLLKSDDPVLVFVAAALLKFEVPCEIPESRLEDAAALAFERIVASNPKRVFVRDSPFSTLLGKKGFERHHDRIFAANLALLDNNSLEFANGVLYVEPKNEEEARRLYVAITAASKRADSQLLTRELAEIVSRFPEVVQKPVKQAPEILLRSVWNSEDAKLPPQLRGGRIAGNVIPTERGIAFLVSHHVESEDGSTPLGIVEMDAKTGAWTVDLIPPSLTSKIADADFWPDTTLVEGDGYLWVGPGFTDYSAAFLVRDNATKVWSTLHSAAYPSMFSNLHKVLVTYGSKLVCPWQVALPEAQLGVLLADAKTGKAEFVTCPSLKTGDVNRGVIGFLASAHAPVVFVAGEAWLDLRTGVWKRPPLPDDFRYLPVDPPDTRTAPPVIGKTSSVLPGWAWVLDESQGFLIHGYARGSGSSARFAPKMEGDIPNRFPQFSLTKGDARIIPHGSGLFSSLTDTARSHTSCLASHPASPSLPTAPLRSSGYSTSLTRCMMWFRWTISTSPRA